MKPVVKNIVGIESLCLENPDTETAVIFFHGYGANMQDLFPLWEMWDNGKYSWYFPNGILPLPMGYYEGRAWFSIDMEALDRAMRSGEFRDMAGSVPPELALTLKQQEHFVLELAQKHKKIVLGGFSQGAMCASHLAMIPNIPLDALILLSGNLLADELFPKNAKGIPFYQSHGTKDPILPLKGAQLLEAKLKALNFQGRLHVFEGGHEIPMKVINEVKAFLHSIT
ncbi:MAG: dienelactone hydrolase family protein [Bdellovibrionales bacterium]|nr:dienelactone hydrolase family protein [Bdellovibrionales bacterium]